MYWFLLLSLFKFLPLEWKRVLSRNSGQNSGFRLPSTEGAGSSHALELTAPKDPTNEVPRDKKWALTRSPPSISWVGVPAFFYFFNFSRPGLNTFILFFTSRVCSPSLVLVCLAVSGFFSCVHVDLGDFSPLWKQRGRVAAFTQV